MVVVVVVVVVLTLVVLGLSGVFPFARRSADAGIGAALRELLLARAEGRVDADEFERRQAALHASLLAAPKDQAPAARKHLRWAVPALIAAAAVALYAFLGNPKVKIPLPESLQKVEGLMRSFGMGRQADELVTTMNRAAEAADRSRLTWPEPSEGFEPGRRR